MCKRLILLLLGLLDLFASLILILADGVTPLRVVRVVGSLMIIAVVLRYEFA